jgi:DNA primase small subunit
VTFERGKERVIGGSRIGPKRDSKGWARRVYNVTERLINSSMEELQEMDGVGRKTAERIVAARGQNIRLLNEGMWDALWSQFKSGIKKQVYSKAVCITDDDKQVTSDISRLIRLPDTIHGGSGLLAMRVNDLGSFNPLLQAVVFKGEKRQIRVIHDVGVFQMMGQDYGPYASDTTQILDEYAAVYLMLKDKAEIA